MSENEQVLTAEPADDNDLLIEQAYEAMAGGTVRDGGTVNRQNPTKWQQWKENFKRKGWILVFILPALIYVLIFGCGRRDGSLGAFPDYMAGSELIGANPGWIGVDDV